MSPSAVPPPPPARAPIGSTASVADRLAQQRPRPLLVSLYAALLGDAGLMGAPARRRAGRALLSAVPAAAVVGGAGLLVLQQLRGPSLGWPQAAALGGLALVTGGAAWRRGALAATGRRAGPREQLELGALFLLSALALVQATAAEVGEPPLQPMIYLVMAFLVAFLDRPVGLALVLLAVALEAGGWWQRGARLDELPALVGHAGFMALFALLYHAALAARLGASRRAEATAVAQRLAEIEQRAREFRLLDPEAAGGDAAERTRRSTEASVVEIEAAVRGALEVAEVALKSHTCAVFLLSDDDQHLVLRDLRSRSDAVSGAALPAGEGALGGAVRRRAPVRLQGDFKAASYYLDGTRPGALLAVPLVDRRGGHVRGVVVADRLEARPFGDEDERLLVTLAAEILRAVAAERLMGGIKTARDEWERFFQALERLNKATKLTDVYDATLLEARRMVPGACFGAVTLHEAAAGPAAHRVARTWTAEGFKGAVPVEGLTFSSEGGSLVAAAVRLEASLPAKDLDPARALVFDAPARLRGVEAVKVIPLRAEPLKAGDPAVLGTLVLGSSLAGVFDQDRMRQLELVALQAGEAVQRARLFDATERLATTDGLTGLTNHRTFQARLDEHLLGAERYRRKVSLLLCDIDHFKSVNDTYGHPVGDVVLKGVAQVIAREARTTDVVARYGGEEFAVVMPETDAAGALVIAERIRERVRALVTETGQGPLQVTLSLGVATFPEDAGSKAALVARADACLYHAKRHGRNQSVAASALDGPRRAPPAPGA
ncbi:MAG: diguanylate cyclase [Anaeromyxobacter sp.]|nr:diguanylate cyclase [Anaeromyxobacter sp.]MBL0277821.1 diguanylate cyclase [Anaeromyxobacter sp.]